MTGSTFAPEAVDVKVGDTVRFVNKDEIAHTATADGNVRLGDAATPARRSTSRPTKAGTFSYVCLFHPGMTGTINVTLVPSEDQISILVRTFSIDGVGELRRRRVAAEIDVLVPVAVASSTDS